MAKHSRILPPKVNRKLTHELILLTNSIFFFFFLKAVMRMKSKEY